MHAQHVFCLIPLRSSSSSGNIPSWLHGTMVRNGPGMFKIGDTEYKHWFDGMAYIQRYHFEDGKMYYSARYLESEDYKRNMKANRIICSSFGTVEFPDPCKTLFQRLFSYFIPEKRCIDNTSVAFITAGDGIYALTESPKLVRIDIDSLDCLDEVCFFEKVMYGTPFRSILRIDPRRQLSDLKNIKARGRNAVTTSLSAAAMSRLTSYS
ncbi:unnamed protein product [Haemonchus placei]|uniref:Sema domain-containing protein n=1 Tax=Haemonchus placei TaxID=6290 RepID=A0A0N4WLZ0_HAEPC|nr:unnamed protein product [Haemonchus placei]